VSTYHAQSEKIQIYISRLQPPRTNCGSVDLQRLVQQMSGDTPKRGAKMNEQLAKSASESCIKKRQQGSLLDQELLVLERDEGKRHARELSNTLLEYAKKIENVQAKNRRLEEEVESMYFIAG
jgi:hypothetical protein